MKQEEFVPRYGVWELTMACTSKCLHCGSDAKKRRSDELTTDEAFALVDELSELGCQRITLSGGEPTMYKDWLKVGKRMKKNGIQVGIITNALHQEGLVEKLCELEPFSVGVSIDGTKSFHDYFRGIQGSYEKVYSLLHDLHANGLRTCAVTTLNHKNIDQLYEIRNSLFVYQVDGWQIQTASPMGRMAKHKDLLLTKKDYIAAAQFIAESRENISGITIRPADCIGYFGSLDEKLREGEWRGCPAGLQVIGIESNGNIKGCLSLQGDEYVEGNVKEKSLREIWYREFAFSYNRNPQENALPGACGGCVHRGQCRGGCKSTQFSYEKIGLDAHCLYRYETEGEKNAKTSRRP